MTEPGSEAELIATLTAAGFDPASPGAMQSATPFPPAIGAVLGGILAPELQPGPPYTHIHTFAPPASCGHLDGCTNPATHQTQRPASEAEAEAHWAALERNIRESNSGWPAAEYVHPRTGTVSIAEFRCDLPEHADPVYLEAKAREATDAA